eukprot:GFKZ01002539.1.p1 GENE.GFKZ01002539.1~~GFKZ01002539.1.p1  ORF type:complete len:761 (-),score=108.49 GFKZ01002539.1:1199-3328(-)
MTSRRDSDQPLKAIVFADGCGAEHRSVVGNFNCLLNLPILSWQLAVLARYGVKETIVVSSKPLDSIYVDPLGRMKVTPLSSESWANQGDAMRDIEGRDDLRPVDDFVLVRQGSVFNVDVSRLVSAHKARKEQDRNWLITTTFRKGAGSASSDLIVAVDKATGTLVKYVEKIDHAGVTVDVMADISGLPAGGTMELYSDVLDVGLDVCAPDFLVEFRENFYYDTVRAYVKEKLDGGEAEVFGNRMYAHFMDSALGQYGTRIFSLASLAQATSDVLTGWMCPISYSQIRGMLREGEVSAEFQGEYLLERTVVGDNASIAVGSTIVDSVIGNDVTIGSDVTIRRSIIMDNAAVGDRCDINGSILSARCLVEENSSIPKNCFLDTDVCIGPDFTDMSPHSLITLQNPADFLDDDESVDSDIEENDATEYRAAAADASSVTSNGHSAVAAEVWRHEDVGNGGKGHLVEVSLSTMIDPFFVPTGYALTSFESDDDDELEEEGDDEGESSEEGGDNYVDASNGEIDKLGAAMRSTSLDEDAENDFDASQIEKFNQEVFETIERAHEENVEVDNTMLELNSLKLAYNCSFAETLTSVVAGLARLAIRAPPKQVYGEIDSALKNYTVVVKKFNKEGDAAHHLQVASGLARALESNGMALMYVYKAMYDRDMLEDEGILGWAASERAKIVKGKGNEELLNSVSPLLEWLEDSEEDEDEG